MAVVTGGSSGIGKAVAKELYDRGCTVVITSRTQARANAAAAEIMVTPTTTDTTTDSGADGVVTPMTLDTSDLGSVRTFAAAVLARFPAVNYLVENAGAVHGPQTTNWVSPEGYEQLCEPQKHYHVLPRQRVPGQCRVPLPLPSMNP